MPILGRQYAARFAPNHRKTEPWRFYSLGPEARARVLELGDATLTAKHGADQAARKMRRWRDVPGWLVVTCAVPRWEDAAVAGAAEAAEMVEEAAAVAKGGPSVIVKAGKVVVVGVAGAAVFTTISKKRGAGEAKRREEAQSYLNSLAQSEQSLLEDNAVR